MGPSRRDFGSGFSLGRNAAHLAVLCAEHEPRTHTNDAVARELFAAGHALQQKAVRLIVAELPVGAKGCLHVRQDVAVHGHEGGAFGEPVEVFLARN